MNAHSSFIYSILKLETAQRFMNRNIDKLWLYSEKRNKLLVYATTWVNHKIIIFSERSHIIDTEESILQDLFACSPRTGMLLLLSHFSRVRLCYPIDSRPPGSAVPGILQARTLEWVAISFSNAWKWKVKVKSLSHVQLCATPWTAAYQAPPSMGFSRQEYWSGVPLPSLRTGIIMHTRSQKVSDLRQSGNRLKRVKRELFGVSG